MARRLCAYGLAVAVTVAALVLRHALGGGDSLLLALFALPITVSALLGGLGPGLVATALAGMGAAYWFIQPVGRMSIGNPADLLQWALLVANGVVVSTLGHMLRHSRTEALARQQRLEAVVSGTSDAVFIKDPQGRYVLINQAGADFVGHPVAEIVGQTDAAVFPPETAALIREKDLGVLTSAQTQSHFEEIDTHGGAHLVFSVTKGPVLGADGAVVGMFGISRDVTHLKAVESVLSESEDRYRSAFEASPDAISITRRADGCYVDVNPSFEALFGWDKSIVVGSRSLELGIWPDVSERQRFVDAVDNQCCENLEVRLINKDGSQRSALVSAREVLLQGEKHILAITKDITARKEAEEALHLASLVYENSGEAMMVTNVRNEIVAVNPAFETITGYTEAEVLGQNPRLLSSRRHDQAFYDAMWSELSATGTWRGDVWNRRKDGELFFEHIVINTIRDAAGQVYRRVALFSDITQQKATEDYIWRQANFDPLTHLPNRRLLG